MPMLTRPLDEQERNDLATVVQRGLERIGQSPGEPPEQIVSAADAAVAQERAAGQKKRFGIFGGKSNGHHAELASEIGAAWGEQFHRALGWDWAMAMRGEEPEMALISDAREYVVFPETFVKQNLEQTGGACALKHLFETIRAGRFTPAERGAYEDLSDGRIKPPA